MLPGPTVIVGLGGRGRAHLRTLLALGVHPVTAVDHRPDNRAEACRIGATATGADLAEAARQRPPALVVVATPAADHLASTLAALDLGAAVVVEKPMVDDARSVPLLAGVSPDAFVCVAHAERWNPAVIAVATALSGAGPVTSARFERCGPASPAAAALGCDLDLVVHDVDLAHHLLGPVLIARRRTGEGPGPPARIVLDGSAGSAVLRIAGRWSDRRYRRLALRCSSGIGLRADLTAGRSWSVDRAGAEVELEVGRTPSLTAFWSEVLAALAGGHGPPVPLAAGLRAVTLARPSGSSS